MTPSLVIEEPDYQQLNYLKLCVQNALLGSITSNLYAVTVELEPTTIIFRAFYYNKPTDDEVEEMQCATTIIISHYPSPYTIEEYFFDLKDTEPGSAGLIPFNGEITFEERESNFTAFLRAPRTETHG